MGFSARSWRHPDDVVTGTTEERKVMPEFVSHLAAPNLGIEAANGVTYAYRRFGNSSTGGVIVQGKRSAPGGGWPG